LARQLKVIGIAGSPRRNGNTDLMLSAALEAVKENGCDVERVTVSELQGQPCRACGGCAASGKCVIDDDYRALYQRIEQADFLLVATPVFFSSVSAQLKALIDRAQPAWIRKYVLKSGPAEAASNRKALLLCCCGFEGRSCFAENVSQIFKAWTLSLDFSSLGTVFVPGVDEKGHIKEHPDALELCRQAAIAMVSNIQLPAGLENPGTIFPDR
jgi:putative NADPH-quinone reductase